MEIFAEASFSSIFTRESLYVVMSLIVIEGLLSVDNALAIAALASHLPDKQRKLAMTIGYAGAYGFRLLALFIADIIIGNHWLMVAGAAYLIWLMCDHFDEDEELSQHPDRPSSHSHSLAKTIVLIAFLDLSLSFDNVVAAVAFARDNIWLVYLGVTIGIITLRLVAGFCLKLLKKAPWLEHTAFILVGFVGILLCTELFWDELVGHEYRLFDLSIVEESSKDHFHIQKIVKFGGILAIILGHLAYEKVPGAKPIFRPFFAVLEAILALFARIVGLIAKTIVLPIIWAANRFRSIPNTRP